MRLRQKIILAWPLIGALLMGFCYQTSSQETAEDQSDQPRIEISSTYSPEQNNFRDIDYGLTREDFRAITETFDFARNAIAFRGRLSSAALGANRLETLVLGYSSPKFIKASRYTLQNGRFLTTEELKRAETVCLIDSVTASQFFGDVDPIGRDLKIDSDYFIVVGVFESDRAAGSTPEICIPLSTMKLRWGDLEVKRNGGSFTAKRYELSEIWIPTIPTRTKIRQLQSFLKRRHESKNDFRVSAR